MSQKYSVYLAELSRPRPNNPKLPSRVYKIGLCYGSDPMGRLQYNEIDEPYPIINTFPNIKLLNHVQLDDEIQASKVESIIIRDIQGKARYFKNWIGEPDKVSGITEMRKWNDGEVKSVYESIELCKEKYKNMLPRISKTMYIIVC